VNDSSCPHGVRVDRTASAPFIQSLHLDRFKDVAERLLEVRAVGFSVKTSETCVCFCLHHHLRLRLRLRLRFCFCFRMSAVQSSSTSLFLTTPSPYTHLSAAAQSRA
jgi:hypothetical protein